MSPVSDDKEGRLKIGYHFWIFVAAPVANSAQTTKTSIFCFYVMRRLPILFFLLASNYGYAQFSLTGKVAETNTNEPLPFASIVLKFSGKGTNTNGDGYFTLLNIPSDTSTIRVTYIGYNAREITLSKE